MAMELKDYIRDIPDFPIPGILFRDITPLLAAPAAFAYAVDRLAERGRGATPDVIVAVESRGFLFGAPLAQRLALPLAPVRKPGKLPAATLSVQYTLEYGENTLELHADALAPGQRALIVDDLLATGGTLAAAAQLVEQAGGAVAGIGVVIELTGLEGRRELAQYDTFSLMQY